MSRVTRSLSTVGRGAASWGAKYSLWLLLTSVFTLSGAVLLMLFKDWTFQALLASLMVWPALGLAALLAVPVSFLPLGRVYFGTAVGGGLLYNLMLLVA